MFVLKRDDGAYVRPGGQVTSYTRSLQEAQTWPTREAAEREACGNETVVPISQELQS